MLTAKELEGYFDRLFPICRSITGPGFEKSLDILSELIPLQRHTWRTGEQVHDWVIPLVWTINDGEIWGDGGKTVVSFKKNNLHVVGYSEPHSGHMPWRLLRNHVHTIPELPDAIPYITSLYARRWGFCMTHNQYMELEKEPEKEYFFRIDSMLAPGNLIVGDLVLPGESKEEILLSSYLCHPSMAINELSGPLTLAAIYQAIVNLNFQLHYTIRFVVCPENIGSVAYLSRFGQELKEKVIAGYVVSCTGHRWHRYLGPPSYVYKRSRQGRSLADQAAIHILERRGEVKIVDYFPDGSDERQYCSPGYNLPVGLIMRKMYGKYPEYHTSKDNKDLICFDSILEMADAYVEVIKAINVGTRCYERTVEYGTPMFSRHGDLYQSTMKLSSFLRPTEHRKMLLDLNDWCESGIDLLTIAEECGHHVLELAKVAEEMVAEGILRRLK